MLVLICLSVCVRESERERERERGTQLALCSKKTSHVERAKTNTLAFLSEKNSFTVKTVLIGISQLPISAARWQHGSNGTCIM
jgi:hypothetical protein